MAQTAAPIQRRALDLADGKRAAPEQSLRPDQEDEHDDQERRDGDGLTMRVTIPVGVEAQVFVPKLGLSNVELTEGGKPVASAVGVSGVKDEKEDIALTAGSGDYDFRLRGE